MATKKQKHAAALAKREEFMEDLRRTGLEAQRKDRAQRHEEKLKEQEEAHEKHHTFQDWCLHCQHIKRNLAKGIDLRPKKNKPENKKRSRRTDVPHPPSRDLKAESSATPAAVFSEQEIPAGASLQMECI